MYKFKTPPYSKEMDFMEHFSFECNDCNVKREAESEPFGVTRVLTISDKGKILDTKSFCKRLLPKLADPTGFVSK